MKTRILGMAIGLGALWASLTGCSQPAPECTVGTATASPFAAKLFFVSGDESCNPSYQALQYEQIGLQVYNPPDSSGKLPDTDRRLVAIQPSTAGNYLHGVGGPESNKAYSLGEFDGAYPESNVCKAATLSPATIVLPEIVPTNEDPTAQAEVDISYTWSDLEVYVTPANLGNQAQATMTYTDNLANCSATYRAVMLWPEVGCEELAFFAPSVPDGECDPIGDPSSCVPCTPDQNPECDIYGTGKPNNALCDQEDDPEPPYEINHGSGLGPDLRVRCDAQALLCVLDSNEIQRPQD
ncbi:hypothetical protein [Chondromyces crocatus]|uniref:Uncharacterized protein n=1 Tax=Chondromyces crocatus TaxID=52 RepID=A0A0K1EJJ8_CHOCO|nr:hypothetical protein [Chondromyces crocatus]AKT41035.1 uncharacterized protein CMC5_051930 [Chondromyces crocatus]